MDFSRITADPVVGLTIGRTYLSTPERITPVVEEAYEGFARQVDQQFRMLTREIRVIFQEEDPYPDAPAMFRSVESGTLRIYATSEDQAHPILSAEQNNRFRAVHDYYGHFRSGRGFDRHGEEAAWVAHSLMFAGPAVRALTTETRGQNSAFIWVNGGGDNFPPQRAVLLPEWMSDIPLKWLI